MGGGTLCALFLFPVHIDRSSHSSPLFGEYSPANNLYGDVIKSKFSGEFVCVWGLPRLVSVQSLSPVSLVSLLSL
jgi:hypothetical protein